MDKKTEDVMETCGALMFGFPPFNDVSRYQGSRICTRCVCVCVCLSVCICGNFPK